MEHAGSAAPPAARLKPSWLTAAAVAVLMGLVLRAAWVNDDAYITLRTVDNLVSGYGLRWNPSERVQTFTHPLWLLVLSVPYWLTRNGYFTLLFAAITTTLCALLLLTKIARSAGHAFVAVLLLMLSRSFIEYSTSGLENPLSHLLVAAFAWLYAVRGASLGSLALCASLLALNRTDALLVTIPALVHVSLASFKVRGLRWTLRALLLGGAPLLGWEAFSLFYYGSLVPNTALAKLNTGLPFGELARQGFSYLMNTLAWDPPLLIALGVGVSLAFAQRRLREALLALGALLYVLYVVRIGGDFMVGRFMTLPLFLAVCLIAISSLPLEEPSAAAITTLPFFALFFHPSAVEKYVVGDFHHNGVADERFYYRDGTSLMMIARGRRTPSHPWVDEGRAARAGANSVILHENIGFFGYFAGPGVQILDVNALSEPLLARLPPFYDANWRVGHYLRHVPDGYLETVKTGACQMSDRSLCEYYAHVREVISGNLFSWHRIVEIVRLNLGSYQHLIDRDRYRYPHLARVDLSALAAGVPENAAYDSPGTLLIQDDGVEVTLGKLAHERKLLISLDGNDSYDVNLKRRGVIVESLSAAAVDAGLMHTRELSISAETAKQGYDQLAIRPTAGDGKYSVGFVRLIAR